MTARRVGLRAQNLPDASRRDDGVASGPRPEPRRWHGCRSKRAAASASGIRSRSLRKKPPRAGDFSWLVGDRKNGKRSIPLRRFGLRLLPRGGGGGRAPIHQNHGGGEGFILVTAAMRQITGCACPRRSRLPMRGREVRADCSPRTQVIDVELPHGCILAPATVRSYDGGESGFALEF